jgi:hypothetical protein
MKYFFLAILLLAGTARAQSRPTTVYQYCALLVDDSSFAYPSNLLLDYGQRAKPESIQNAELQEASEKIRKMNSIVAALNYLSVRGWECWNVNTVQTRNPVNNQLLSETHYLLRRSQ